VVSVKRKLTLSKIALMVREEMEHKNVSPFTVIEVLLGLAILTSVERDYECEFTNALMDVLNKEATKILKKRKQHERTR
jgi:hypothetical protein